MSFSFRSVYQCGMGFTGHRHETATEGERHSVRITLRLSREEYDAICRRDLEVTIEPVQTRDERLREARTLALRRRGYDTGASAYVLQIIERVDAEFAKWEK